MDLIRAGACYDAPCRLFKDSDEVVTIHWYPAPAGAQWFPGWHRFASGDWSVKDVVWHGPGEVGPFRRRKWTNKPPSLNYKGQCFIGPREWFEEGVPRFAADLPPPPWTNLCADLPEPEPEGTGSGFEEETTEESFTLETFAEGSGPEYGYAVGYAYPPEAPYPGEEGEEEIPPFILWPPGPGSGSGAEEGKGSGSGPWQPPEFEGEEGYALEELALVLPGGPFLPKPRPPDGGGGDGGGGGPGSGSGPADGGGGGGPGPGPGPGPLPEGPGSPPEPPPGPAPNCCGCTSWPQTWGLAEFPLNGPFQPCGSFSGGIYLNWNGGCHWVAGPYARLTCTPGLYWELSFGVGTGGDSALYRRSVLDWECIGQNEMTLVSHNDVQCSGWPQTLTLVAI